MIGPEPLSSIKRKLRQAFAKEGKDAIQRLEERMQQLAKKRPSASGETKVLQALKWALEREVKTSGRVTRSRKKLATLNS